MKELDYDVIIIGAGISGVSAAYHIQTQCPHLTYRIVEARSTYGGTWSLFQYPGIRSDSDMYTLGFSFYPWQNPKAIADGPSIQSYLGETIEHFGIDQHITYDHKVDQLDWDTDSATWTLHTQGASGEPNEKLRCRFVMMCAGYYRYDQGYRPTFPHEEKYNGEIIHPQHWPEDYDYTDKVMTVIGSGATAVTLAPELAKKASKVYMLQRSPTYMTVQPYLDKTAGVINATLPSKMAYKINRFRKRNLAKLLYTLSRRYPKTLKKLLIGGIKKELKDKKIADQHFTPQYNPWDQRLCLVPDGDLFKMINEGKVEMVTDQIASFSADGIELASGDTLKSDAVVTATGLNLKICGGVDIVIDGEKLDLAESVSYKSAMLSRVPNMTMTFGYTNASWTLKSDLISGYAARLLNHMHQNGHKISMPECDKSKMEISDWLNIDSGYIKRSQHLVPKAGNAYPWNVVAEYKQDKKILLKNPVDDTGLVFS